jgi:hypothetical protein
MRLSSTAAKIFYSILVFLTFLFGYLYFKVSYDITSDYPFTQEIILIILGTIVTMIITAALLNRQTEVELQKEQRLRLFELKSQFYIDLLNFVEEVFTSHKIGDKERIKLNLLTHKLSIIASPDVLYQYEKFLDVLNKVSDDINLTEAEEEEVSLEFSKLCAKIRVDLLNGGKQANEDEFRTLEKQILLNAKKSEG